MVRRCWSGALVGFWGGRKGLVLTGAGHEGTLRVVGWWWGGAEELQDVAHVALRFGLFAVLHHEVRHLVDNWVVAVIFVVAGGDWEIGHAEFDSFLGGSRLLEVCGLGEISEGGGLVVLLEELGRRSFGLVVHLHILLAAGVSAERSALRLGWCLFALDTVLHNLGCILLCFLVFLEDVLYGRALAQVGTFSASDVRHLRSLFTDVLLLIHVRSHGTFTF